MKKAEITIYKEIISQIALAKNILLLTHRRPDPDAVGSTMAMRYFLNLLGKSSTMASVDKVSDSLMFLPGSENFVTSFKSSDFDLLIYLDCGFHDMTLFHDIYPEILDKSRFTIINIDHHASNDNFGTINFVDSGSASTTLMLYRLLKVVGVNLDENISTALLLGLYGDTGGFMHSNTNAEVYNCANDLLSAGAKLSQICFALTKKLPPAKLRLWGKAFEKAKISSNNVLLTYLDSSDYNSTGATSDDLTGVIDYLNMVKGTKFSALLAEDSQGRVKGSLRTNHPEIDLSKIAGKFGGGGHPKASGFLTTKEKINESELS